MPPQLVGLDDGTSILLDKPILLVGRHQECDIQIPSRKISRRHCCIAQVNDHLVVRDLCSTNGIRINGVRVNEGSLKSGDELAIGNMRYQVRWPQAAEPVAEKKEEKPAPKGENTGRPHESGDQPIALQDQVSGVGVIPRAPGVGPPPGKPPFNGPSLLPENLEIAPSNPEITPPP